jgi:hypothetical protein
MNSNRDGKYFQCPIRALRVNCRLDEVTREQAAEVFASAICYSISQLAKDLQEADDARLDIMADIYLSKHEVSDDDFEDADVLAVAAACEVLGTNFDLLSNETVNAVNYSWERIEKRPGSNTLVRIRADLMHEFQYSWEFRDAAILCGVFAGVGDSPYRQLTCDRIRTLAMGFASGAELRQHGAKLPLLTDRQVRHTLGKLEARKLFQCGTPDWRHVYYTHRLSEQELISALAKKLANRKRPKSDKKRAAIIAAAQNLISASQVMPKGLT